MLFFEPGAYEDFIFKLSTLRAKPPVGSWDIIGAKLKLEKFERRESSLKKFLVAATILALTGFGSITLLLLQNSAFDNSNSIALLEKSTYNRFLPNYKPSPQQIVINNSKSEIKTLALVEERNTTMEVNKIPTAYKLLEKKTGTAIKTEKTIHPFAFNPQKSANTLELAATTTQQKKKPGKWSLSIALAPSYSYHTAGFKEFNYYSNEHGTWMWSGEILAKKEISKRFSVYSGLSISPAGQSINDILLLSNSEGNKQMEHLVANTTFGWISLDNQIFGVINSYNISNTPNTILKSSAVNKVQLSQQLHYLEIPFILSYSLYSNQTQFDFKAGYAAGILVSNRFIIKGISKKIVGETEGVNRYNSTAIASVCFSAPISSNVKINIEPTLKIGFQPLKHNNVVTYPFSTSVKFGVNYRF